MEVAFHVDQLIEPPSEDLSCNHLRK